MFSDQHFKICHGRLLKSATLLRRLMAMGNRRAERKAQILCDIHRGKSQTFNKSNTTKPMTVLNVCEQLTRSRFRSIFDDRFIESVFINFLVVVLKQKLIFSVLKYSQFLVQNLLVLDQWHFWSKNNVVSVLKTKIFLEFSTTIISEQTAFNQVHETSTKFTHSCNLVRPTQSKKKNLFDSSPSSN